MEYGEKISALRKARGMTQAELGNELNVTFQAVSNWERGETIPDFETLSKISKIFGVSISYFENNPSEIPAAETLAANTTEAPASNAANSAEMIGVCTVCGKVVYKGDEGQTSPAIICTDCVTRQNNEKEAAKQKAAKKAAQKKQLEKTEAKRMRNKGFIVSGAISGILIALMIAELVFLPLENPWEAIGYDFVALVFIFTFIAQLFWKGTVVSFIALGGQSFGKLFSWGGLVAFILLGWIIIPILIGFLLICIIISFIISPFAFIPETIRICRACKA